MDSRMDSHAEEHAASLFERAQAGDQEAFGQLFELHRGKLESLAYLALGPRLRTRVGFEDVVQETFIKAFKAHASIQWQGSRSFFRWLAGIAEHVVQREARRNKDVAREIHPDRPEGNGGPPGGWRLAETAGGVVPPAVSPLGMLRRIERFERLEAALQALSPDRREALVCAHIHGLSTKEIARRLGRSPGAVGVLLHRAKDDLKRRFGDTETLHLPARALRQDLPAEPAPGFAKHPAPIDAAGGRRGWRSR
jgi:RNA polymerase sigma factor (sigma-70 family)